MNGDYDILVATTIIETGIDIPNVNTLLIENADHMGLSTLYQLRGRVGRSNRIAYAYLMYHPDKSVDEKSQRSVWMLLRDLQNWDQVSKLLCVIYLFAVQGIFLVLLKGGFIDSVGFEMYSQLLEEAINKRQGKTQVRRKGMQSLIFRLMLTFLLTIFLTSAKKLKFISVFVKLRIRKTTRTFKMS